MNHDDKRMEAVTHAFIKARDDAVTEIVEKMWTLRGYMRATLVFAVVMLVYLWDLMLFGIDNGDTLIMVAILTAFNLLVGLLTINDFSLFRELQRVENMVNREADGHEARQGKKDDAHRRFLYKNFLVLYHKEAVHQCGLGDRLIYLLPQTAMSILVESEGTLHAAQGIVNNIYWTNIGITAAIATVILLLPRPVNAGWKWYLYKPGTVSFLVD